jgi:hypothetical protein
VPYFQNALGEVLGKNPDLFTTYAQEQSEGTTQTKFVMVKLTRELPGVSELVDMVFLEDFTSLWRAGFQEGDVPHELPAPPPKPQKPIAAAITAFTIFIEWQQPQHSVNFDTMIDKVMVEWKPKGQKDNWDHRIMPGHSIGSSDIMQLCIADLHAGEKYDIAISYHNSYGWSLRGHPLESCTADF